MKVSTYNRLKCSAETVIEQLKSGEAEKCRVGTKVWKFILINSMDKVFIDSELHTLTAKHLGVGVYEITATSITIGGKESKQ